MAKRVLSIRRMSSPVSMTIGVDRPSVGMTGKSPEGSTGRCTL
jgi:hypothetical protein